MYFVQRSTGEFRVSVDNVNKTLRSSLQRRLNVKLQINNQKTCNLPLKCSFDNPETRYPLKAKMKGLHCHTLTRVDSLFSVIIICF